MSQREYFEEAASRMGYSLRMRDSTSEDGDYGDRETQGAWDMWQECCVLKVKAEPVAWSLTFTNENGVPCRDVFWSLESVNEHRLHNTEKRKLLCTVTALYTKPQSAGPDWIKCSDRLPGVCQRVILKSNGVIQNYMPTLDSGDIDGFGNGGDYFWDFDDAMGDEDFPLVDFKNDEWAPQPQSAE